MKILHYLLPEYLLRNPQIIIILSLVLLNILLYKITRVPIKLNDENIKITNYYKNWFFVGLYLGFFISFFFLLRLARIHSEQYIDLKTYYYFFLDHLNNLSITKATLGILGITTLILLWIIIFVKIKKLLTIQLIAFHIFQKNKVYLYQIKFNQQIKNQYIRILKKFDHSWNLKHVIQDQMGEYLLKSNIPNKSFEKVLLYIYANILSICRYLPLIILFVILMVDITVNNLVLICTTYYLPVYVTYMLWYKYSFFLNHNNPEYDKLIAELCYGVPEICFPNLESVDYKDLDEYLENWCQDYKDHGTNLEINLNRNNLTPIELKRIQKVSTKQYHETDLEKYGLKGEEWIYINSLKEVISGSELEKQLFKHLTKKDKLFYQKLDKDFLSLRNLTNTLRGSFSSLIQRNKK